jgi:HK97 gp10 family phage protein
MAAIVLDRNGLGQVRIAVVQGTRFIADEMAGDMRRYAPVETGELKATIRVETFGELHRIWIGDVAGGVDYHLYQEFGTSVMAAQPFIRPAVYQRRG